MNIDDEEKRCFLRYQKQTDPNVTVRVTVRVPMHTYCSIFIQKYYNKPGIDDRREILSPVEVPLRRFRFSGMPRMPSFRVYKLLRSIARRSFAEGGEEAPKDRFAVQAPAIHSAGPAHES